MDNRMPPRTWTLVWLLIIGLAASAPAQTVPESVEEEAALARGESLVQLPEEEVFSLEQRRRALDRRAAALDDQERQLLLLQKELDARLTRLTALQGAMEEYLNRWRKQEEENLAQLVKVYEAMRSEAAATTMGKMDERLATAVLARMNEKKAAKVMNLLVPEKAVNIARRMGRGIP
jgi:flagellar motility protein MotE (MotC chaperone)